MEKDKIELKTSMETAEVADYLTALASGFRAGRIVIEKDGEHLVLSPAEMSRAEVEIEARIKKDKAKFSLELSWQLAPQEDECVEFKISSELPKPGMGDPCACDKKPHDEKPATQGAALADKPAAAQAKSDVKPTAPAVNEPGGKAMAAAGAQAKPKP